MHTQATSPVAHSPSPARPSEDCQVETDNTTYTFIDAPDGAVVAERLEQYLLRVLQSHAAGQSLGARGLRNCCEHSVTVAQLYQLVQCRATATQRDVYYRLVKYFPSQKECDAAIRQIAAKVKVPREALNVYAGMRGALGGNLVVDGTDLRDVGPQGLSVEGRMVELCRDPCNFAHRVQVDGARCLLLVEKDAVFYRLMSERFFDLLPAIIVTGFGFPSVAVRALAAALAATMPSGALIVGLVDYNPAGVDILLQYAGATAAAEDSTNQRSSESDVTAASLRTLKWLVLPRLPNVSSRPHTPRERAILRSLPRRAPARWRGEIETMAAAGVSHEIESWYPSTASPHSTFSHVVAQHILRRAGLH